MLTDAKNSLYENDPSKMDLRNRSDSMPLRTLKKPSEARAEVAQIKAQLEAYKTYKEESMFLGKRNRILSHGWRHGIVG